MTSQVGTVFTEDSRSENSYDFTWVGAAGASNVLPADLTAVDFKIPMGRVGKITGFAWIDSPNVYVPNNFSVRARILVNGATIGNLQRVTSQSSQPINLFDVGFYQGVFFPLFFRAPENAIITLCAPIVAGAVTFTFLQWYIRGTLGQALGQIANKTFTNEK